ncbi:MAG: hypothetical protein HZA08_07655 [Nitrospirae bacterium]|nr:hypothetical protein [Nitrospirota bacterium]
MKTPLVEQAVLTEAVTYFIERLHEHFSGIRIRTIAPYEDEEFALEILVPTGINIDEVEEFSLRECIYLEDHYDVYLLVRVVYAG